MAFPRYYPAQINEPKGKASAPRMRRGETSWLIEDCSFDERSEYHRAWRTCGARVPAFPTPVRMELPSRGNDNCGFVHYDSAGASYHAHQRVSETPHCRNLNHERTGRTGNVRWSTSLYLDSVFLTSTALFHERTRGEIWILLLTPRSHTTSL